MNNNFVENKIRNIFKKHNVEGMTDYDYNLLVGNLTKKFNTDGYKELKNEPMIGANETEIRTISTAWLDADMMDAIKKLNHLKTDLKNTILFREYVKYIDSNNGNIKDAIVEFYNFVHDDVFFKLKETRGIKIATKYAEVKAQSKFINEYNNNDDNLNEYNNNADDLNEEIENIKLFKIINELKLKIGQTGNQEIKEEFQKELNNIKNAIQENDETKRKQRKQTIVRKNWKQKINDTFERIIEEEEPIMNQNVKTNDDYDIKSKSNPLFEDKTKDFNIDADMDTLMNQFTFGNDNDVHVSKQNFSGYDLQIAENILNDTENRVKPFKRREHFSKEKEYTNEIDMATGIYEHEIDDGFNSNRKRKKKLNIVDETNYNNSFTHSGKDVADNLMSISKSLFDN